MLPGIQEVPPREHDVIEPFLIDMVERKAAKALAARNTTTLTPGVESYLMAIPTKRMGYRYAGIDVAWK
jgi:hypothetical protein